jgi:pyridoxamine 5'-phosphate oxidase family protein
LGAARRWQAVVVGCSRPTVPRGRAAGRCAGLSDVGGADAGPDDLSLGPGRDLPLGAKLPILKLRYALSDERLTAKSLGIVAIARPGQPRGGVMFSDEEAAYMKTQRLARLATVAADGQPTVDAVGFAFDGERFYIGGINLPGTRKHRNVAAGNRKVALIIDDLASVQPWMARGIKIHGVAEIVSRDGFFGPGDYLAITPEVSWSWGIVGASFQAGRFAPHKVAWPAA